MEKGKTKILAVAGKGGVGKTSIAATIVRILVEAYPDKKILAIDADPAVGLSTALGIEVETTIDDIRRAVVAAAEEGDKKSAIELLGEARYRIFDALVETDGFSFIAIGRPEAAGCYCKINTYLKEVISILSENFDYVVIDGEAGIEQINRRVMEKVTHLLLITDASRKGTQVVQTIRRVADELVMYEKLGLIANRLPSLETGKLLEMGDLPVLACIPADGTLAEFDLKGENVFYLPADAAIVQGTAEALQKMGLIP
ncbi:MAG: AAA family ATPase [Lachnospiraceae bacterium]|nr:AAA family ATPase [Lachnospiraceae bacterium]